MNEDNPHKVILRTETEGIAECTAEDCGFVVYTGRNISVMALGVIWRDHASQYEPGRVPDIEVDWTATAWCPKCDTFRELDPVDDFLECQHCHSYWDYNGRYGTEADQ